MAQPRYEPIPTGEPTSDPWAVGSSYSLDLDLRLGYAGRLDDPPRYRSAGGGGLLFGIGADLFLSQRISVGLAYEHIDLPNEESGLTPIGTVRLTRDLNSTWTRLRLYPLRTDDIGTYLALGAALSWQSVGVSGSVWPAERPDLSQPLRCEGGGSVSFALRGESGVDVAVGGGARVQLSGTFGGYRLTDTVLGQCAPGAGSATMMSLRLAVVYGWGLS